MDYFSCIEEAHIVNGLIQWINSIVFKKGYTGFSICIIKSNVLYQNRLRSITNTFFRFKYVES